MSARLRSFLTLRLRLSPLNLVSLNLYETSLIMSPEERYLIETDVHLVNRSATSTYVFDLILQPMFETGKFHQSIRWGALPCMWMDDIQSMVWRRLAWEILINDYNDQTDWKWRSFLFALLRSLGSSWPQSHTSWSDYMVPANWQLAFEIIC